MKYYKIDDPFYGRYLIVAYSRKEVEKIFRKVYSGGNLVRVSEVSREEAINEIKNATYYDGNSIAEQDIQDYMSQDQPSYLLMEGKLLPGIMEDEK
ncbi:hypothetical protein LACSTY_000792 [Lacticaseibacillus styriensis]|uniref:Uncharacterized protein n=2 Tax=Lacticaseibacillus TaxID=2759736 RepID=A0AAN1EY74_LACCA|nr:MULTISPECIES: hypothetical protein [Lacticaseibacillus]ARY90943.1 hypothetical protein BGL52_03965 [Lacticaseibacillus casei]WLV81556.1 hypothetical protein LACSTY_000792 [Lacticaseibacillus sp. NCIMB 15473]